MQSYSKLYLLNRVLCSPLEILFTLLVFILSKNLNALAYQLTLIACLKPITSFFAFYASSVIFDKPQRIRRYLFINSLIGCVPCLFYPFVKNVWFYIASYTLFMITMRAASPAWIEVLKSTFKTQELSKIFSKGTSITYGMTIFFPPICCFFMDQNENLWRYLFMGFAILHLLNIGLISLIKPNAKISFSNTFVNPLKQGWSLLLAKPALIHYQLLFFLGGVGIIMAQPILPQFFKDNLNLSYTQLGMAFSFCKGISFVLTSSTWAKYANRLSLYHLNCFVNLFTSLFFAFIWSSQFEINLLYLAYLFYGTMQAGCEMSWNLSGPFFSGKEESTIYSSLNLAFVGIRGCICPFLGYLLFINTNANVVFATSCAISLIGIVYGVLIDRKYQNPSTIQTNSMVLT